MTYALKLGSAGPEVERWQHFLIGAGFHVLSDGKFGQGTREATIHWQQHVGLADDGVVGNASLARAAADGYPLVIDDPSDLNFPVAPTHLRLMTQDERFARFGHFQFVPKPESDNREAIHILGDWVQKNIVLRELSMLGGDDVQFHKGAVDQFMSTFDAWQAAGLVPHIITVNGSFVPRFIRGSDSKLSEHAFGAAIDLNAPWNKLGTVPALHEHRGCVRDLVGIANENDLWWGGHNHGSRIDGMHFGIGKRL